MSQVKDRKPLLEEEDDDSSADLQINSRFARQYELRKQREELTRFQRDEGSDDSDSSSSEDEDEDGSLLTTRLDVDILKTIHAIRSKDPKIYNPNVQFFHDEDEESEEESDTDAKVQPRPSKAKKRYQDVVREQILEKMNSEGDVESEDEDSHAPGRNRASYDASRLAYDEQQQRVRQEFLQSMQDMEEEEEFVPLRKTKRQPEDDDDDEEAREAFAKELERLKELKASAAGTKADSSDWKDPRGEVSNGYDYMLQYFEKKPWKKQEKEDSPVGDDDEEDASSLPDVEQADEFEATYNFRYETAAEDVQSAADERPREPASGADHSNISYARSLTMETLRRKDDRRVQKRQERLERKAQERKMKEEQLKRLKNAKRLELNQKLQQIRSVLGQVKEGGNDESHPPMDEAAILKLLEEDFDPEKFESIMAGICSDDYYNQNDSEWKNDLDVRKSLQSGMEEEDGEFLVGPDDGDGGLYDTVPEVDDEDIEHHGDAPAEQDDDDWVEEEEWQEDTVEHEMERKIKAKMEEELYKLDYEDIVAGIPTRFKYRSVPANNYGLSTMEILCARDTTLKQYVSLKKLAPYVDQEYVVRPKKRQKFRQLVRQEIEELVEAEAPKKKRRKKGKGTPEDAGVETPVVEKSVSSTRTPADTHESEPLLTEAATTIETKSKRKRRKKRHTDADETGRGHARRHAKPRSAPPASDARLAAYGL